MLQSGGQKDVDAGCCLSRGVDDRRDRWMELVARPTTPGRVVDAGGALLLVPYT